MGHRLSKQQLMLPASSLNNQTELPAPNLIPICHQHPGEPSDTPQPPIRINGEYFIVNDQLLIPQLPINAYEPPLARPPHATQLNQTHPPPTSVVITIRMLKMESNLCKCSSGKPVDTSAPLPATNAANNRPCSCRQQSVSIINDNHRHQIMADELNTVGGDNVKHGIDEIDDDDNSNILLGTHSEFSNNSNNNDNHINNNTDNSSGISNQSNNNKSTTTINSLKLHSKNNVICDTNNHISDSSNSGNLRNSNAFNLRIISSGDNYPKRTSELNPSKMVVLPMQQEVLQQQQQQQQQMRYNNNNCLQTSEIQSRFERSSLSESEMAELAQQQHELQLRKLHHAAVAIEKLEVRENEDILSQCQCPQHKKSASLQLADKRYCSTTTNKEMKVKKANWLNCAKRMSMKSTPTITQPSPSTSTSTSNPIEPCICLSYKKVDDQPTSSDQSQDQPSSSTYHQATKSTPIVSALPGDIFLPAHLIDAARHIDDYPIEDCDETARIQRAWEIAEGVDPPPGFQPSAINPQVVTVSASGVIPSINMLHLPAGGRSTITSGAHATAAATAMATAATPVNNAMPSNWMIGGGVNNDDLHLVLQNNSMTDLVEVPRIIHSQIDYIHCLVPDLKKITNCSFYWGKMDRYEAERLLDGKPEGTFLLRDSAQEEFLFSVSFRKYGRSLHARIEQFNHKFSFDCHDPGVFTSNTVTGLLEHYKDPACVMFFEPALTLPLNRNFSFTLQQLCRATIVSHTSYDGVNDLTLPTTLKAYLKEYHYKQRVRVKQFDQPIYSSS